MSDDAKAARARAEAARAEAEARKFLAEAQRAEYEAEQARLALMREQMKFAREQHADDYEDRVYRFLVAVDDASVRACIAKLDAWHRADPECPMTIIFDSPGGSVVPGFHLFDHVLGLRAAGHHVTTMTRGYALLYGLVDEIR